MLGGRAGPDRVRQGRGGPGRAGRGGGGGPGDPAPPEPWGGTLAVLGTGWLPGAEGLETGGLGGCLPLAPVRTGASRDASLTAQPPPSAPPGPAAAQLASTSSCFRAHRRLGLGGGEWSRPLGLLLPVLTPPLQGAPGALPWQVPRQPVLKQARARSLARLASPVILSPVSLCRPRAFPKRQSLGCPLAIRPLTASVGTTEHRWEPSAAALGPPVCLD